MTVDQHPTEQAVLGAILSGYPYADEIVDTLDPKDFLSVAHEQIFRAITTIVARGEVADAITVKDELGQDIARLQGGAVYLIDLAQQAPNVNSAPTYAKKVKEYAMRRRVAVAGTHLAQLSESDIGTDELADRVQAVVNEATTDEQRVTGTPIADVLPEVLQVAENGRVAALPTPWPGIDRLIRGIAPGRLVIVGARPGNGKSLMLTNLALHMAHIHKHAVLLCSMEMGKQEVTQRILSSHASVNLTSLAEGTTDERSWQRIAAKTNDVLSMPVEIDDSPNQTLTSIRLSIRNLKRRRPDTALVAVDYLQLMGVADRDVNRVEQIGQISRGLKIIAREFNVCVVAAAQVNRASTHRPDMKPTMSDLRESGSIEADADVVILLHRPIFDQPELDVTVAKNRSGETGGTSLNLVGHHARLETPLFNNWTPTQVLEGIVDDA